MAKAYGFPIERVREAEQDERGLVRARAEKKEVATEATTTLLKKTALDIEGRRRERKEHGLSISEIELLRLGADALDREIWSFGGSGGDRPMLDHLTILDLVNTFGAYYESGEIIFPDLLPDGKKRPVRTSRKGVVTAISPLAGRRSFEDASRTVRKMVLRTGDKIAAEFAMDGRIFSKLPEGAPDVPLPEGHAWRCWVSGQEIARGKSNAGAGARTVIAELTVEFRSGPYPRELYDPWYAD